MNENSVYYFGTNIAVAKNKKIQLTFFYWYFFLVQK